MTFLLSREGVVYQKDLGEKTTEIAASIKDYNPTQGWPPPLNEVPASPIAPLALIGIESPNNSFRPK